MYSNTIFNRITRKGTGTNIILTQHWNRWMSFVSNYLVLFNSSLKSNWVVSVRFTQSKNPSLYLHRQPFIIVYNIQVYFIRNNNRKYNCFLIIHYIHLIPFNYPFFSSFFYSYTLSINYTN